MLTERRANLLNLIVEAYVDSAVPVGSKSIVEKHRVSYSPATVRLEMARLEDEGFRLRGLRLLRLGTPRAEAFYAVHRERPFFRELVTYMCSGPVVVTALERENAVPYLREVVGATDPAKATPGTLRALHGRNVQENAVHASDSPENAAREVAFFFADERG